MEKWCITKYGRVYKFYLRGKLENRFRGLRRLFTSGAPLQNNTLQQRVVSSCSLHSKCEHQTHENICAFSQRGDIYLFNMRFMPGLTSS